MAHHDMAPVRTFRLALCALALLGLTRCSDPVVGAQPPCVPTQAEPPEPAQHSGLMKVGQRFTLSVMPLPPPPCTGELGPPTSVLAEIEGPSGEPVEGQIQLGAPGAPATLQFTPVRPGKHHILIAFSRVGGVHQFDFHAVADSSASAPSFTLNRPCASVQRTRQGSWVCDTAVVRGEAVVATFPNTRLAVAGDVLWAVSGSDVHRYVDTGTDLVLTGALRQLEGDGTFLMASDNELLVVHDVTMALYAFSGGTLTSAGTTRWDRPYLHMGSSGPFGLFLREEGQLALVSLKSFDTGVGIEVCPYQFDAGRLQRTPRICVSLAGEVAGFEPRVLWTVEPPMQPREPLRQRILRRWEWGGGQLIEQGSVLLEANVRLIGQAMLSPSIVPVIHAEQSGDFIGANTAVAVWSAERREISFEHLDADVIHFNASPTFYWGVTPQTGPGWTTKVRLRPAAPIR